MNFDDLKKLWPAGLILSGVLAWLAIPRDLMGLPEVIGDWVRLIPFGREALPQLLVLALIVYGSWRLFRTYILPLFAHRIGPWKNDRISMCEFIQAAGGRHHWDFSGSLQILDLFDGIGQAFADGSVQAFGRYNPNNYSGLATIYLVPIHRSHWRLNYIDVLSAFYAEDNVQAVSRPRNDTRTVREYVDLHLNRVQAKAWLARESRNWKGRRERDGRVETPRATLSDILK